MNESITPSMFKFMVEYCERRVEEDAVDAYFDLPIKKKIEMHRQTLKELYAKKELAEEREAAAMDAMLDDVKPFSGKSPIAKEYAEFMTGIVNQSRKDIERLEREIHEEEQWRGGHEKDSFLDPQ